MMNKDNDDLSELCDQRQKKKKTRKNIIQEILQTERAYEDDLRLGITIFLGPNKEKMKTAGVEVDYLFGNFSDVASAAGKLRGLLEEHVEEAEFDDQMVGFCFLEMAVELQVVYSLYCANYDDAMAHLEQFNEDTVILQNFNKLLTQQAADQSRLLNLSSLLIKPIQRISKYPLLLGELLKATESSHKDYTAVEQALSVMTEVVLAVNESKRKRDLVLKYRKGDSGVSFKKKLSRFSYHSLHKKLTRVKGYMSASMGMAIAIKDETFDIYEQKFELTCIAVSDFHQDLINYLMKFKNVIHCLKQLTEDMVEYQAETVPPLVEEFATSGNFALAELFVFQKILLESSVICPLAKLLDLYKGPQALIDKRMDKLLELQGDETLEHTRREYNAINSQLVEELPKLWELSIGILTDSMMVVVLAKKSFLEALLKQLSRVQEHFLALSENDEMTEFERKHERIFKQILELQLLSLVADSENGTDGAAEILNEDQRHSCYLQQRKSLFGVSSYDDKNHHCSSLSPGVGNADFLNIIDLEDKDIEHQTSPALVPVQVDADSEDNGFYYALLAYKAHGQYEVPLYEGQFVTVVAKHDGSGNSDWWEVSSDGHQGYVPSMSLAKADDFMETATLPDLCYSCPANVDLKY